jgi:SHS2 domain-containing protein
MTRPPLSHPAAPRAGPLPVRNDQPPASHVVEETFDGLQMSVRAPSLEALFAEAPLALADALGVAGRAVEATDLSFKVEAENPEALLLVWLTDLLAHTQQELRLFVQVAIDSLSDGSLQARVRGAEITEWRAWLRPHTRPQVHLAKREGGYEAVMLLPGAAITSSQAP